MSFDRLDELFDERSNNNKTMPLTALAPPSPAQPSKTKPFEQSKGSSFMKLKSKLRLVKMINKIKAGTPKIQRIKIPKNPGLSVPPFTEAGVVPTVDSTKEQTPVAEAKVGNTEAGMVRVPTVDSSKEKTPVAEAKAKNTESRVVRAVVSSKEQTPVAKVKVENTPVEASMEQSMIAEPKRASIAAAPGGFPRNNALSTATILKMAGQKKKQKRQKLALRKSRSQRRVKLLKTGSSTPTEEI